MSSNSFVFRKQSRAIKKRGADKQQDQISFCQLPSNFLAPIVAGQNIAIGPSLNNVRQKDLNHNLCSREE
jgi:hypothetical protein